MKALSNLHRIMKPFYPAFMLLLVFSGILLFKSCLFDGVSNETLKFNFDVINIIFTIFFSFVLIIVTLQTGENQERVQRDTIKIQLFDKRYQVFKALVNSRGFITKNRNGYFGDEVLVYGDFNIPNKEILNTRNDLYEAMVLSEALFDDNIYNKMQSIYTEYNNLCKLYFDVTKYSIATINENELSQTYANIIKRNLFNSTVSERDICDEELKSKFPSLFCSICLFNRQAEIFESNLIKSGIYSDFDKYIKIFHLDK